jgi:hypothetical protein
MKRPYTRDQVQGAFSRLRKAMGWPQEEPWVKNNKGGYVANVGVVYLAEEYKSWCITKLVNDGGGEVELFPRFKSKRQATETMIAMAQAVEMYKRDTEEIASRDANQVGHGCEYESCGYSAVTSVREMQYCKSHAHQVKVKNKQRSN